MNRPGGSGLVSRVLGPGVMFGHSTNRVGGIGTSIRHCDEWMGLWLDGLRRGSSHPGEQIISRRQTVRIRIRPVGRGFRHREAGRTAAGRPSVQHAGQIVADAGVKSDGPQFLRITAN